MLFRIGSRIRLPLVGQTIAKDADNVLDNCPFRGILYMIACLRVQRGGLKVAGKRQVAAYVRVSSKRQVREGQGLDTQRQAIEVYCKQRGWQVGRWFEDPGITGDEEHRPGLLDLTAAVEDGTYQVVLIDRLDRLARRLMLQETVLEQWQKAGAEVVSLAEPDLGGKDPERVLFRQVLGAVAQFQKAVLLRRMSAGRVTKATKGGYAGGRPALGYRSNGKALRIVAEEAETVRRILRMHNQAHLGYQEIARTLNAEGIATKRGGKWYASTVRAIVLNPVYRGQVHYGEVVTSGQHEAIR
jgi:DNA invertase Pin-like site-specific DNA recombinase